VNNEADAEKDINTKADTKDEDEVPRALHRTQSVFLRNLPASITRQEIEEVFFRHFSIVCNLSYMFAEFEIVTYGAPVCEQF